MNLEHIGSQLAISSPWKSTPLSANQVDGLLVGTDAELSGRTITGNGVVSIGTIVTGMTNTMDVSNVSNTLQINGNLNASFNITSTSAFDKINAWLPAFGTTLTLTAMQAHNKTIYGSGNVEIIGSAGDQKLSIGSTGTNTITPGAGADSVFFLGSLGTDKVVLKFGAAGNPSTQTIAISDAQAATVTQFSIVLDSADNTQDVTLTNAAIAATNGASLAAAIQTQLRAAVPFTYTEASYAAGVITISEWAGRAISATNLKTTSSTSVGTVSTALNGNESTRSDSYVGAYDTIGSFTVETDKIDLLNSAGNAIAAPTALTRFADVDGALVTTHQELINRVLNSSSFLNVGANKAGMIVVTNGTYAGDYLFINDGDAPVSSASDLFVKLLGTTGLGNVGALTVSDYFA